MTTVPRRVEIPWRGLLELGAYFAVAGLFTWPLLLNLASRLPLGSESSATLPLFNLWTLSWNAERALQLWSGYWDAPIFYPQPLAFGLSDPMPFTGILFALGWVLAWGNSFLAYNLCLLAILVLNGVAACRLSVAVCGQRAPSVLVGILAVGLPWVANELGVIQLTVLFPVFFALEALVRFFDAPGYRLGIKLGLWSALAYLSSTYYGVYLSLFVVIVAALLVRRHQLSLANAKMLACGAGLYVLLLVPVVPGQLESTAGFRRNEQAIAVGSATAEHFTQLRSRSSGAGLVPWLGEPEFRGRLSPPQRLYPGTALSLLSLLGLVTALRCRQRRRVAVCFGVLTGLAFYLSFGPRATVFGFSLYESLQQLYPGFSQIRSSFRLAAVMQIGLLVLAGPGLAWLWQWRGRRGPGLAAVVVLVGLAEVLPPAQRLSLDGDAVYAHEWLAPMRELPPGPVAHLPPSPSGRAVHFEPVVVAMLQALVYDKPLLNGYSGYFPDSHRAFRTRLRRPAPADIDYLKWRGVRYLLVDLERAPTALTALLAGRDGLRLVFETEEVQVYEFVPSTSSLSGRQGPHPERRTRPSARAGA